MRLFLVLSLLLIAACAPAQQAGSSVDGHGDIKFSFNTAQVIAAARRAGHEPIRERFDRYDLVHFGPPRGLITYAFVDQQVQAIALEYYDAVLLQPGEQARDVSYCERQLALIQADFDLRYGPARRETGNVRQRPFTRLHWQSGSSAARATMILDLWDSSLCSSVTAIMYRGAWEDWRKTGAWEMLY
jgi:hypothetical protein